MRRCGVSSTPCLEVASASPRACKLLACKSSHTYLNKRSLCVPYNGAGCARHRDCTQKPALGGRSTARSMLQTVKSLHENTHIVCQSQIRSPSLRSVCVSASLSGLPPHLHSQVPTCSSVAPRCRLVQLSVHAVLHATSGSLYQTLWALTSAEQSPGWCRGGAACWQAASSPMRLKGTISYGGLNLLVKGGLLRCPDQAELIFDAFEARLGSRSLLCTSINVGVE